MIKKEDVKPDLDDFFITRKAQKSRYCRRKNLQRLDLWRNRWTLNERLMSLLRVLRHPYYQKRLPKGEREFIQNLLKRFDTMFDFEEEIIDGTLTKEGLIETICRLYKDWKTIENQSKEAKEQ